MLYKIAQGRSFLWLIRAQLWALGLTVFAYAVTPVDALVVSSNVRRILAGDPAPSVQITVHPISSEGFLLLEPLLDCDNKTIREGIQAMLAHRYAEAQRRARQRERNGWTAYQIADTIVHERLHAIKGRWVEFSALNKRDGALARFRDYAYQWY